MGGKWHWYPITSYHIVSSPGNSFTETAAVLYASVELEWPPIYLVLGHFSHLTFFSPPEKGAFSFDRGKLVMLLGSSKNSTSKIADIVLRARSVVTE